ncbi:MAG: hypothetical protein AAFP77_17270 [Bacteroidota bacterium]
MWVRIIAILFCVVFLINGCNSLISQFFGTHKLRTFSMSEVLETGIGDSDYVRIEGAWQSGDYIVVPPRTSAEKAILIFPLLSEDQLKAAEAGEVVEPRIICWTKDFSLNCDEENTCAPRTEVDLQGIIRKIRKQKNKAHLLATNKYSLPENVDYVEVGRSPLAWYWNLLIVLGSLGFAFFIEQRANKKRQLAGSEKSA